MSTKKIREVLEKVRDVRHSLTLKDMQTACDALADVEALEKGAVALYAKVLIPPGPEEIPEMAVLYSIALEVAPVLGMRACPKCNAVSGDDWSQCGGSCPRPDSPHYQRENGGAA